MSLADKLSAKTLGALAAAGLTDEGVLRAMTREDLELIDGMGPSRIAQIEAALGTRLERRDSPARPWLQKPAREYPPKTGADLLIEIKEAGRSGHSWPASYLGNLCVVYFIYAAEVRRVKIGIATEPYARLRSIQTGSPVKLSVLGYVATDRSQERSLHAEFAHLRKVGEWFDMDDALAARIDTILAGEFAVRDPLGEVP